MNQKIEGILYATQLINKETHEYSWEIYNAVYIGDIWYIERLKPGDTKDESITINYNGSSYTLYRLNDNLYQLSWQTARCIVHAETKGAKDDT